MKRRTYAAVAALTVLAAACDAAPSAVGPRDAVLDAMDAVYEAPTVHQDFEISVSSGGESIRFRAEGEVDNERRRATMRIDLGLLGGSMEMVMDGDVVFLRAPMFRNAATPWIGIEAEDLDPTAAAQLGGTGTVDPSAYLGMFAGITTVEVTGEEQLDGVVTTRYSGTIDISKVLPNFPDVSGGDASSAMETQIEAMIEQFEALGVRKTIPFEVWIDRAGFARRERMTLQVGGLLPGSGEATMQMTIGYSAFGAPVDIDVPARSEVTMVASLDEALP